MALYDEALHPRARGKFASKPLSPQQKKQHATIPVKRTGIVIKDGSKQQGGDFQAGTKGKKKMA